MENNLEFHIKFSLEKERNLWNNLFSNGLIHIPTNCPKCQHNVSIIQNNTLNNLILLNGLVINAGKNFFKRK